jgi:cell division ATPase MinD
MGKTIGIVSLKGGVGKTTTVASLGAALNDFGKKVLLIDGNLSAPNLGLHLNIVDPEKTLHDVLNRKANVEEAIYEYEGFDVLPASLYPKDTVNALKLKDHISGLKKKYDVILIDSSPSLNEETLAVILAADEIFVITTPDHATLSTTIKAVNLAKQRGTPINGIIINKAHNKGFDLSLSDIEDTLEVPVLAVVPYDKHVVRALSFMQPFVKHSPNSDGSVEIKKLAAVISGDKYDPTRLKDFFKRLKPEKQEINRQVFYQRIFK